MFRKSRVLFLKAGLHDTNTNLSKAVRAIRITTGPFGTKRGERV